MKSSASGQYGGSSVSPQCSDVTECERCSVYNRSCSAPSGGERCSTVKVGIYHVDNSAA